ncbi:MAG: endonuclease III [Elusimicrobia bacterium]|nr:endonuclease III [Elusimicrobiota bacterium]
MNNSIRIYEILNKKYPEARTALNFNNAWQILVATILSAQCTDKRVNEITKELFRKYPDVDDYVNMKKDELVKYIRSAGFFNNKSKSILAAAKMISRDYGGRVPDNMKDMLIIPGVARKTANIVISSAYGVVEGIAVDTHVKRLSYRLGLTKENNPDKIERDLMKTYPKEKWYNINYILIEHGRATCKSQRPLCSVCELEKYCPKNGVDKKL